MTRAVILLATVMAATSVGAAEIKVLSAGAVEPGLRAFAQLVNAQTGHDLAIQFNTAPRIAERLGAGETFDILISPPAVIDQAIRNGKVVAESRIAVGRVCVGIVVRSDAPAPDVATVDALKQSLLGTDAVVYNTASTGLYLDRLFEKMGVLDQLKPKTTRYADGAAVMVHVLNGKGREIGFGPVTVGKVGQRQGVGAPERIGFLFRQFYRGAGAAPQDVYLRQAVVVLRGLRLQRDGFAHCRLGFVVAAERNEINRQVQLGLGA